MHTTQQCWTQEQAQSWYRRQPVPFGCNFLPSTAVNSTEMWQADTFDRETITRELGWAARCGFNSCRVFLPYLVWKEQPQAFKERFEHFLAITAQYGLSTMPILFDDCAFAGKEPYSGPQEQPVPGVHNSGWTPSPGAVQADDPAAWPQLERYVKDLVSSFGRDTRILLWDLYNEPGNNERGNKSVPLLQQVFHWARDVRPTQPLSAGVWGGSPETDEISLTLSDIVTFHDYSDATQLAALIDRLKQRSYPLICTEWMARTLNSRIATHLPIFEREKIGNYMWGLVSGKTQTYFPWGSPKDAPEPELWFHDLLRPDGTAYRTEEIALLQEYGRLFRTIDRSDT